MRDSQSPVLLLLAISLYFPVSPFRSAAAVSFSPPAKPAVPPLIASAYIDDTNQDKIDDQLLVKAQQALAAEAAAVTPQEKGRAKALIERTVEVELVFKEQINQAQMQVFAAQGGQIAYVYQAVSYG